MNSGLGLMQYKVGAHILTKCTVCTRACSVMIISILFEEQGVQFFN